MNFKIIRWFFFLNNNLIKIRVIEIKFSKISIRIEFKIFFFSFDKIFFLRSINSISILSLPSSLVIILSVSLPSPLIPSPLLPATLPLHIMHHLLECVISLFNLCIRFMNFPLYITKNKIFP